MLKAFAPYDITSTINTSYDGGESYDTNSNGGTIEGYNTYGFISLTQTDATDSISANWKNSYKYTATANEGYSLAYIEYGLADTEDTEYDKETSTDDSYTFEEVTSDYEFVAYFIANSYTIAYNSNGRFGKYVKYEYNI